MKSNVNNVEEIIVVADNAKVKKTVKDSVFTNLFGNPKYLLQLYQALHPEDKDVREEDLKTITLENIFTDDIYNDLGFAKGEKLMILMEAQSTWTVNIIVRALEYLVNSYRRYFSENSEDLYRSRKVKLPKPELYVIFTGDRENRPKEIKLSEEFFDGEKVAIEVNVKMIYDGKKGDIINQYVSFTRVLNEQVKKHGRTKDAVREAIRICKDSNVLKEYLEKKESEVVDIMMQLYDQEEVMRVHDIGVARDSAIRTAVEMCQDFGMTFMDAVEKIAAKFSFSKERAESEVSEYWNE